MATSYTNRTALFHRAQPGGIATIDDFAEHPGNIFFVDSGQTTTGSDAVGYGRNPDAPFVTLDYAIDQCTANQGDIIYVMPGHSETRSTTGAQATMDVAGIRIVGLGDGADRPTFTFSHTGATWTWSAASCSIENLLFVTGIDLVVTYATISGADATIKNCETRDTTNIEVVNAFTCTGDRLVVDGLFHNGYTSGDANVAVITMAGVDRAEIKNCRFITKVTTAVVNFTASNTAIEVHDCDFLVDSTTDLSKNVVATGGTNTWAVWDVFDLGAGGSFSGGSGAAVASDDLSAVQTNLTSSATSVTTHVTSVGTAVGSIQTNLTSSASSVTTHATSVGTAVDSIQTNLTSSASSVTTHATSVGTAVDSIQTNLTSSASSVTTHATSVGTAVDSIQTNLTSSAGSVGTGVGSIQTNLTSSASSVTTHATSVGTAVDSIQTNLTSSASSVTTHATSVGTAVDSIQTNLTSSASSVTTHATSVGTAVGSIQTNLTSSATSVGTGVGSIQTNLTSSATSVGTVTGSVGTQAVTDLSYLTSEWTSWDGEWVTQYSYLVSAVKSVG